MCICKYAALLSCSACHGFLIIYVSFTCIIKKRPLQRTHWSFKIYVKVRMSHILHNNKLIHTTAYTHTNMQTWHIVSSW